MPSQRQEFFSSAVMAWATVEAIVESRRSASSHSSDVLGRLIGIWNDLVASGDALAWLVLVTGAVVTAEFELPRGVCLKLEMDAPVTVEEIIFIAKGGVVGGRCTS